MIALTMRVKIYRHSLGVNRGAGNNIRYCVSCQTGALRAEVPAYESRITMRLFPRGTLEILYFSYASNKLSRCGILKTTHSNRVSSGKGVVLLHMSLLRSSLLPYCFGTF